MRKSRKPKTGTASLRDQTSDLQLLSEDNPQRWNETISQLPYNHVLQSYQWGQFKSRHGWSARHLVFRDNATIRGAALVLQRKLPQLPWGIMYVSKGPMLDYSDAELVNKVLFYLEKLARQQKVLLIKIDPDVSFEDDSSDWARIQSKVTAPAQPVRVSSPVIEALTSRGWNLSNEQVQFKNTVLIDLGQSEEELLARMKPKTRYNIRLASRKGVRVRLGGIDDLGTFYGLYSETSARDEFLIRPFEYYNDVWRSFLQNGMADLLLAEWEGKLLAGLMLFRLGRKAWYMYGASSNEKRNLMPNHLLQWEAIRRGRQKGCVLYDLWGAPDVLDEGDPMWGVYRFKKGLGGQTACHIGAYDFSTNPILTRLYTWLLPRYLSLSRSRLQQGSSPTQPHWSAITTSIFAAAFTQY